MINQKLKSLIINDINTINKDLVSINNENLNDFIVDSFKHILLRLDAKDVLDVIDILANYTDDCPIYVDDLYKIALVNLKLDDDNKYKNINKSNEPVILLNIINRFFVNRTRYTNIYEYIVENFVKESKLCNIIYDELSNEL